MKKIIVGLFSLLLVATFLTIGATIGEGAGYVGAAKCKACHMKQYKAWEKTKMATSFENLKPGVKAAEKTKAKLDPNKDYTTDQKCLKCHTTGYGKSGGFKSFAETPKMVNVQCEACHGPGSEFTQIMKKNKEFKLDEVKAAGYVFPKEASAEKECLECHGGESPFSEKVDPKYKFVFKDRLKNTHEHFPLKYKH
ncbi:MAG: cytochrome c family protein [Nitrospirae bacterium]|nr:cytochrome c family protein [Nitrospirota bacterium]